MNDRNVTTPADLGARSRLLADKHAAYIKRVAEVSLGLLTCNQVSVDYIKGADLLAGQQQPGVSSDRAFSSQWHLLGHDCPLSCG